MTDRIFLPLLLGSILTLSNAMPSQTKPLSATSADGVSNFTAAGPLVNQMKDGATFIDRLIHRTAELRDYSTDFELTVFKNGSTVKERGEYSFKQPKLIRLEETGDYKNGSVAVLGKDGKAHGHFGGPLKFLKGTISPDSAELRAANGYPLKNSDFLSLASYLKKMLAEGCKSRVSEQAVVVESLSHPVYVLEMYRQNDSGKVQKRIFIEPTTLLPLRWDDFDYAFPSVTVWRNVKTNIGLSDNVFQM
jgi:outer membrane lipoprotein-sorting protein